MSLGLNGAEIAPKGFNNDVPTTWWAALWKLTQQNGLWALVACTMIYVMVVYVVPALARQHEDHMRLQNYLEALCLNAASTDVQFRRCNAASIVRENQQ